MFHTDRSSGVKYGILNAEEGIFAHLGACLRLMSDDMGDHPVGAAFPLEPRIRTRPKLNSTKHVWKQWKASIYFFGASFARIRERRAGQLLPEDRALVW